MAAPALLEPLALLSTVIEQAVLAPSSHNTQPWVFRIAGGQLDLYADRTRALPVNDPHDRELTISCGAALLNARVAAAHAGVRLDVVLVADDDDPDLLARATQSVAATPDEGALFAAIPVRRTFRADFEDREISTWLLARLADAAAREGADLEVLTGARRGILIGLVADGDRIQFSDERWRRELAAWLHPRRTRDGLAYMEAAVPVTRFLVSHFDFGREIAGRDARLAERAPVVALLATPGDGVEDWLRAGQALERVLLQAAAAGVQASFLNQPMQVDGLRPRANELLRRPGWAQIALRLGYPTRHFPSTPRRPAAEVTELEVR